MCDGYSFAVQKGRTLKRVHFVFAAQDGLELRKWGNIFPRSPPHIHTLDDRWPLPESDRIGANERLPGNRSVKCHNRDTVE